MTLRSATIYGLLMPILIFTMGARAPNISALSQEYKSVPSFPNERIYEGLMNNILFDEVMANPNTIEVFRKENAQIDNVEQAILRKQFLLAETKT